MGLRSVIFVPERAPEPKVTQLLIFGATVLRVRGSYEQAFQLCQQACEKWGWYNRNSGINPYLVEGKKTVGLEIGEQLGWEAADWVAVSVGDGCTIAGVVEGVPRNEDAGADRAHAAHPGRAGGRRRAGDRVLPERRAAAARSSRDTIADSIAVGVPRNWKKAVLAVRESGGTMINVSDERDPGGHALHRAAGGHLRRTGGGHGGCRLAPRASREGIVGRRASAVAIITGNGLKDIAVGAIRGRRALRHPAGRRRAGRNSPPAGADRRVHADARC